MEADQQKKRLNANSIAPCNSREQYKAKMKKLGILNYNQRMRSNISLEWDEKKRSVVAKKDQIGISWRHLMSFIDSVHRCKDILADIITLPEEVFGLENLIDVLSYEVWETYLSEDERNLLRQFLPKGVEPHGVVKDLLEGNNLHFGNPFLKWGGSLCRGNLHPDVLLHQEKHYRSDKTVYHSFLNKYHDDMIGNLQTWKEKWESCKDPEKEFIHKIWRLRRLAEESSSILENDSTLRNPDDNLVATSESGSWTADELACISDNPNLKLMCGELQGRRSFSGGNYDNLADGLKFVARPRKGVKQHKRIIQCGDGAKYMSYVKITKEQHQLVKSIMKQSSNSIQQKSLNSVLGDLDTLHVRPYELFEIEEQRKLHEHWLLLANRDLPTGFANWRKQHLQKRQLAASLGKEIIERTLLLNEDGNMESICNKPPEQIHYSPENFEPTTPIEDDEAESPDSLQQELHMDYEMASHESSIASEDEEIEKPSSISSQQKDDGQMYQVPFSEDDDNSALASMHNQHLQQIASFGGGHDARHMALHSDSNHENTEPVNVSPVGKGDALSTDRSIWQEVTMPSSIYNSTALCHEYASSNDLSLGHTQVMEERPAQLVNLESDLQQGSRKDLFARQTNDGSLFTTYSNQDRNERLQSFFKGPESLSYHPEQKQSGLRFQPVADVMMETSQLPGHFPEQLHSSLSLELRQKRLNEFYMRQNILENIYSDGRRPNISGQDHFSPFNIQNWPIDSMRRSAPSQSHLNSGELLTQNWFSGEQQARIVWSGSESALGSNQSIGSGSSGDQSLFGVLSQCNELRSGSSYDSMGDMQQYIYPGSYGGAVTGILTAGDILPQTANPLNCLGGNDAASGIKASNLGLMNLQRQTSALQDSLGKSFLRSWNR